MMHFCLKLPMNNWRPMRAKTARQNKVKIMTSFKAFTDSMSADTIAFNPENKKEVSLFEFKKSKIKSSLHLRHYDEARNE